MTAKKCQKPEAAIETDRQLMAAEIRRLRRELAAAQALAQQDPLLPVLNRRAFIRELERYQSFGVRHNVPACLLYLDLDGFKTINDAFGHAAGDAVLQHFVAILLSQVRKSDIVARLGGDEFAILLLHVTYRQAVAKAANLSSVAAGRPAHWNGTEQIIGFSFGVHELRAGEDAASAIACADRAMFQRKRSSQRSSV